MRLLVDMGNSRVKWTWEEAGTLGPIQAFDRPHTEPETAFARAWGALQPSAGTVCAVTGDAAVATLQHWAAERWGLWLQRLCPAPRHGALVNAYRRPEQLGADRWANLLGARARLGAVDAVVADAGTAVTVDALGSDGVHRGGAILGGIAAARAGLGGAAPALTGALEAADLPALDTGAAIGGGTLVGTAGALERVGRAVARDLYSPRLLLTGGDAERLRPWLEAEWTLDPLVTLRGLQSAGAQACAG